MSLIFVLFSISLFNLSKSIFFIKHLFIKLNSNVILFTSLKNKWLISNCGNYKLNILNPNYGISRDNFLYYLFSLFSYILIFCNDMDNIVFPLVIIRIYILIS